MLIDEILLRYLARRLAVDLSGSRVEKIFQPVPTMMVFHLHPSPEGRYLALSWDRPFGFIGLVSERPPNPTEAPAFCMLLRKHLKGARLTGVGAPLGDRLVRLRFERSSGTKEVMLVLGGPRPNLLLLDGEGASLGKGTNYSGSVAGAPDDPDLPDISGLTFLDWPNPSIPQKDAPGLVDALSRPAGTGELVREIPGLSPGLARLIIECPISSRMELASWLAGVLSMEKEGAPCLLEHPLAGRWMLFPFSLPEVLARDWTVREDLGALYEAVERLFFRAGMQARLDRWKRDLSRYIDKARKRLTRRLCSLEEGMAASESADDLFHQGELLKTVMSTIPPRAEQAEVYDWKTGSKRLIALSPKLDARGNLERIFARAKKAARALPLLQRQLDDTKEELLVLKVLSGRVASATGPDALSAVEHALGGLGMVATNRDSGSRRSQATGRRSERGTPGNTGKRSGRNRKRPVSGLRRYVSSDGLTIYAGRSAAENDVLTGRIMKPGDLWFHVQDSGGAHVVVKMDGRKHCPETTRHEAALLAAHFSRRRYDGKVEVREATGRDVRRVAGLAPGKVLLRSFRSRRVVPDPTIVRRLVERELASATDVRLEAAIDDS